MDFSYSAEAERFRKELRTWLAANLTDDVVSAGGHPGADPVAFDLLRRWNATMADAGWAAVSWPPAYGGRGASVLEQLVYAEETTRARVPNPLNIIGINNIAPAIMQYGTEQQKTELLPRMLRADDIWCQGMSEPESGSDLASLRTRAVRDGTDFVVNGQKIWTSLGHRADWCQLYVRTDPDVRKHEGISCFIVDMSLPGIDVRPLVTLNGDEDFAEVFFTDVRIPADALLGPLNGGWQVATTTLSHERAAAARLYSELQVRLADLVTDLTTARVGHRPALDDPITLHRIGGARTAGQIPRSAVSALHFGDPARRRRVLHSQPGQVRVGRDRAGSRGAGVRRTRPSRQREVVGLPLDRTGFDDRGRHHADQQEHHGAACAGPPEAAMSGVR